MALVTMLPTRREGRDCSSRDNLLSCRWRVSGADSSANSAHHHNNTAEPQIVDDYMLAYVTN